MKNQNLVFLALTVLLLSFSIIFMAGCGDDDDDDDDDKVDQDVDVIFDEDGLQGADEGGPLGAGVCTEDDCLAMLTFMDECHMFNCQDENQQTIPCVGLLDHCVACGGNWAVNLGCYEEFNQPNQCFNYVICCAGEKEILR